MTRLQLVRTARRSDRSAVLFCIVHNEDYILPHFFRHYDQLGIGEYIFFDDRSTDRTFEILASRDDVSIYQADSRYGDIVGRTPDGAIKRFGSALKSNFFELMGTGARWAVIVDADEFLVFPGPLDTLSATCQHLEARMQPYLTASMVDFYPARLALCRESRASDPFSSSPYFDRGPLYDWTGRQHPLQYKRGVRLRLLKMLIDKDPNIEEQIFGKHGLEWAKTWKVPLLQNVRGLKLVNDHEINLVPNCRTSGCLVHFKFAPNIIDKIEYALRRKSYYNLSVEYRFLQAAFDRLGDADLVCEETVRFTGKEDLKVASHLSFSIA
jgi:hypothetical protein